MSSLAIDTLGYVRTLEEAGFTRKQAEAQATKGDMQDVRLEVEKVRAEIEKVRAELKLDIEQLRTETKQMKYDLLKWQLAGWVALAAIMAKGFNWLGF